MRRRRRVDLTGESEALIQKGMRRLMKPRDFMDKRFIFKDEPWETSLCTDDLYSHVICTLEKGHVTTGQEKAALREHPLPTRPDGTGRQKRLGGTLRQDEKQGRGHNP